MELHQEPNWREKAIKNLVEILSAYRINVRYLGKAYIWPVASASLSQQYVELFF